jgi:hypothetical protein
LALGSYEATLPEALVVDDADLEAGISPERISSIAGRDVLVIVTLPKHLVLDRGELDPAWARVADFALEIVRPDLLDRNSLRPGEADFHLVKNRWGPTITAVMAFQGHYSRFAEMAS